MNKVLKKTSQDRRDKKLQSRAAREQKTAKHAAAHPVSRKENASRNSGKNGGDEIRIRMYRVGFGDFFLMSLLSVDPPQHIVIDCGVTRGKTGKGDIGTIKTAVADMMNETDGKLALIIMTHRHMDHIIGFSRCPEFEKVQVEAIWMPAWESEYDSNISNFQEELNTLAADVQAHLAAAEDDSPEVNEMLAMVENATGDEAASGEKRATGKKTRAKGTGGGSNKASLKLLKQGLGVKPQYYYRGQKAELPKGLADAGLTAEILGPPPIEATDFMKLKDLKKGVGQYLDAAAEKASEKTFRPFRTVFEYDPKNYSPQEKLDFAFREWWTRDKEAPRNPTPWLALKQAVDAAQPTALLTAVKQLDGFLNNQSLVVLFTFRGKKLLFAGDAQAGNWEYWLYDGIEPTKTPSEDLGELGKQVLGKLDFYKVGHHGSTNATPIAAVKAMNAGLVAMCSTQEDSFGSVAKGSEVPRIPLMEALDKHERTVVRSDQIAVELNDGVTIPPIESAPAALPKPQPGRGRLHPGPCYVDYFLSN